MKKHILLILMGFFAVSAAIAQSDNDYYLDLKTDNLRYYFNWDDTNGYYTLTVPKLEGNFKIYNSKYEAGVSGQDAYIFGATNGGGITIGSEKTLGNPGEDMSVEGGGIIYNACFIFDPKAMTLVLENGSTTEPEPTEPAISIAVGTITDVSPETAVVSYVISTSLIDDPTSLSYDVTFSYTNASGDETPISALLDGELTGDFNPDALAKASLTPFTITAKTTYNGTVLTASTKGEIQTVDMPILIGQIAGHEWQPDYGIEGKNFLTRKAGPTYYYNVTFSGDGEFSFVTKLDPSWDVVNQYPRYAPPTNRVLTPMKTWMPYKVFAGSTENAWYPENFNAADGNYVVEFDFATKSIALVKGDIPAGTEDVNVDMPSSATGDVYSLSGMLVRRGVDAAHVSEAGLAPGFYIVDGHKVLVR